MRQTTDRFFSCLLVRISEKVKASECHTPTGFFDLFATVWSVTVAINWRLYYTWKFSHTRYPILNLCWNYILGSGQVGEARSQCRRQRERERGKVCSRNRHILHRYNQSSARVPSECAFERAFGPNFVRITRSNILK